MASGPAQPKQETQPREVSPAGEWFAVTADGASALRIAPGLIVGEGPAGALALNDPDPARQWIEFDLAESGEPSVMVITREKSLLVEGVAQMRYRLAAGASLRLPNNTLHISRDIGEPATSGPVLEIVSREVPVRPQDLIGPGWQEALEAARAERPAAGADPSAAGAGVELEEAALDPRADEVARRSDPAERRVSEQSGWIPDDPDDEPWDDPPSTTWRAGASRSEAMVTVAERRPGRRRPRRAARSRQPSKALYATAAILALAAIFAVLLRLGPGAAGEGTADGPTSVATPQPPASAPDPRDAPGPRPEDSVPRDAVGASEDRQVATDETAAFEDPVRPPEEAAVVRRSPAQAGAASAGEPDVARDSSAEVSAAEVPAAEVPAAEAPAAEPPAADPPLPAAGQPEGQEVGSPRGEPDWRLGRARELIDSGYITYPPQDNAVAYLRQVLAADPNNPQALALLTGATEKLLEAAERAHDQGLDYEARNTLEEVLGFDPDNREATRLWRQWVGSDR